MSRRLDHAVGLLERSLVGTRTVLGLVEPGDLGRATPCAAWDLAALLGHMDDSLGAYLEASQGALRLVPALPPAAAAYDDPAGRLRVRVGTLLGAWAGAAERDLDRIGLDGPAGLAADLLVSTAALEVAVHGWDVARSLGAPSARPEAAATVLPPALAQALLPVARRTVAAGRTEGLFAGPLPACPGDGPVEVLLGLLGRPGRQHRQHRQHRQR